MTRIPLLNLRTTTESIHMGDPTKVFWNDLARELEDPEFLRDYIIESVRIQAIDRVMNQIEDARDQAGMSKAELARAINAKPAAIRRLLSAKSANPTIGTLSEIAAVLGYSVTLTPLSSEQKSNISIPLLEGTSGDLVGIAHHFGGEQKVS